MSTDEQREVLTQTGKDIFGAINMGAGVPKKRKSASASTKQKRTFTPCPVCSKRIAEDALDKHMAASHPRDAKAAAAQAKRSKDEADQPPGVAIEPRSDPALAGDAQGWADLIGVEYRNAVEDIIKIGLALTAAKESLPHGEFGRIFADHENPVEHPVPFSKWSGQQFMKIANNEAITNAGYSQHLPAAWRTLAYLAPLPAPIIEAHIEDGTVTPNLKQGDAYRLYREWKETQPYEAPKKSQPKPDPSVPMPAELPTMAGLVSQEEASSAQSTQDSDEWESIPTDEEIVADIERDLLELIHSKMRGHTDYTDDDLAEKITNHISRSSWNLWLDWLSYKEYELLFQFVVEQIMLEGARLEDEREAAEEANAPVTGAASFDPMHPGGSEEAV